MAVRTAFLRAQEAFHTVGTLLRTVRAADVPFRTFGMIFAASDLVGGF